MLHSGSIHEFPLRSIWDRLVILSVCIICMLLAKELDFEIWKLEQSRMKVG